MSDPVTTSPGSDVSTLLRAWSDGDQNALDRLTPIVYDELRRLAGHYLRQERTGHSLQATALVNEAYLRLIGTGQHFQKSARHFRPQIFMIAANEHEFVFRRAIGHGHHALARGERRLELLFSPSDRGESESWPISDGMSNAVLRPVWPWSSR